MEIKHTPTETPSEHKGFAALFKACSIVLMLAAIAALALTVIALISGTGERVDAGGVSQITGGAASGVMSASSAAMPYLIGVFAGVLQFFTGFFGFRKAGKFESSLGSVFLTGASAAMWLIADIFLVITNGFNLYPIGAILVAGLVLSGVYFPLALGARARMPKELKDQYSDMGRLMF